MRWRQHVAWLMAAWLGLSGCAAVLIGAGAAGGYAISNDSVKNAFDRSPRQVYRHSLAVVKKMGETTMEDVKNHRIEARVQEVNVVVTIKSLTKQTVELEVSARNKLLMPRVDVAQEVYNAIVERMSRSLF